MSSGMLKGRAEKKSLPLWVKLGLLAFVAVLVPSVWGQYGIGDLLWLCHICLILTLVAAWLENPLLASMAAVGVLVIQSIWLGGFLIGLAGLGVSQPLRYMFDPRIPLFMRSLSLVHGWLPLLLLFMVKRLGYDKRALARFVPVAGLVFVLSYFLAPPPPAPTEHPHLAVNINFVRGLSSNLPQTWMPPGCWLLVVWAGATLALFLPAHLALTRLFAGPQSAEKAS